MTDVTLNENMLPSRYKNILKTLNKVHNLSKKKKLKTSFVTNILDSLHIIYILYSKTRLIKITIYRFIEKY